jgi:hypothetical protein
VSDAGVLRRCAHAPLLSQLRGGPEPPSCRLRRPPSLARYAEQSAADVDRRHSERAGRAIAIRDERAPGARGGACLLRTSSGSPRARLRRPQGCWIQPAERKARRALASRAKRVSIAALEMRAVRRKREPAVDSATVMSLLTCATGEFDFSLVGEEGTSNAAHCDAGCSSFSRSGHERCLWRRGGGHRCVRAPGSQ